MENETSPPNESKSWFSDLSWKTALIVALLSTLFGGGAGTALVATKGVQAQGVTQDQADVRYLTKGEADRRKEMRDKDIESINKKIEEKMLSREVFEAYHQADAEKIARIEKMIEQILTNQNK